MANLLPPNVKAGIQKNYRIRLVIVTLFMTAVLILAAFVMLLPSYVLVDNQEQALENLTAVYENKVEGKNTSDPMAVLEKTEELIAILDGGEAAMSVPYEIIAKVLEHKNDATTITQLSYLRKANDKNNEAAVVSINGVSKDRENLQAFVAALRTENIFSEVEDPYQNYIESEDLQYTLVVHVVPAHD